MGEQPSVAWRAIAVAVGVAAAAALAVLPAPAAGPGAGLAATTVGVDARRPLGPTNEQLGGVGWNTGALDGVAPLEPPVVRIDASLERVSDDEGATEPQELQLAPLLERVAAVRAIGAEPVVILSYMPAWLAEHGGEADPRDPTRVGPADVDMWQDLVYSVVKVLATAPEPAYRFEVWNEPDWAAFWQDSLPAFVQMAERTHAAVAEVADDTGTPLQVGGPATLFPDPAWMVPYLETVRAAGLPLDFVSWHYYANYPFVGPDGAEDPRLAPVYPVIGRRNPVASPTGYRDQVAMVRAWTDAALAGSDLSPALVIDEWNLSAAGFDRRHDSSEGAAFAAASLMEMEAAGLDAADFYRAADSPADGARVGDWGLVDWQGSPKPVWWVFHAWRATRGTRLATEESDPELFTRATRSGAQVHVLAAAFAARGGAARRLVVAVEGVRCRGAATVRLLSGPHGDLAGGRAVHPQGDTLEVLLPAQSVAWVTFPGCR